MFDPGSVWQDIDWGNLPTGLAAGLTAISLFIAARTFSRAQRDSRREHADKVAAWLELPSDDDGKNMALVVTNASNLPIYHVIVRCEGFVKTLSSSGPTVHCYEVIPPDGSKRVVRSIGDAMLRSLMRGEDPTVPSQPKLNFRDSMGQFWERAENGMLSRSSRKSHEQLWKELYAQASVD